MWHIFFWGGLFLLQFHSFHDVRKPACSSMKACWLWPRAITPMPGAGNPEISGWKVGNHWLLGGLMVWLSQSFWMFLDFSGIQHILLVISSLNWLIYIMYINTCTYFQSHSYIFINFQHTVDGCKILHHLGWLNPIQNNGMFTTYQLVIRISSIHSMIIIQCEAPVTIVISTINHSYWSYKPTERYRTGAPSTVW